MFLPRWYPNPKDIQLGTFIQEQAILMAGRYEVSVIYVQQSDHIEGNYKTTVTTSNGITEIRIDFKTNPYFKKLSHFNRYVKAQRMAFKLLKSPIDLCHVHVPIRPVFLALKLLKKAEVPFIITEHWSGHLNGQFLQKSVLYKSYYRKILSKAAKITTVSSFLQSKFKQNTGFDSIVVPNYIQRHITLEQELKNDNLIQILTIADLHDLSKNINGLIHGFSNALIKNDRLRLTIVGGGPDQASLENLVKDLKLERYINFTGRLAHDEVLKTIPACDFYICNSNFESFGMTVAEALYSGKPVVSTKCGGPEEFVNTENGLLIDVNDQEALIEAILNMANNFQLYKNTAIVTQIEQRFGKRAVEKQWANLYNSILPG